MRLYNPHTGQIFDTASDDELHVQVYLDAGLEPAPPDPDPVPGLVPEPVTRIPVAKTRRGKSSPK